MIPQVHLSESAWQMAFPHRVTPHQDEWLVSVLLRCDEVNHWGSGTTFRYLLRSTHHPGFGPSSSLIVVPSSLLERLAQFLILSQEHLLATTYSTELARLYPLGEPYPELLLGLQYSRENWQWRRRLGQREIATERKIHLCPACIAQTRTIGRTVTLPHLHSCPLHHIAFQEHCFCGEPLSFFSPLFFFTQGRPPFTCIACGLDWARWPQTQLPPDRVALERDLFALYEFFLLKGTDELKASALRLARRHMREHEPFELRLTGRKMKNVATRALNHLPLGYVVDILVSVGISPSDIIADDRSLSWLGSLD